MALANRLQGKTLNIKNLNDMKTTQILLIFMLFFTTVIFAQLDSSIKAKLYFAEAEKAYNQGDFSTGLDYIIKTENTLNNNRLPRVVALRIKLCYAMGYFKHAKNWIDLYTKELMGNASQELNEEVLAMYINIEEAYNNEIKEKERQKYEKEKKIKWEEGAADRKKEKERKIQYKYDKKIEELNNLSNEDIKDDLIGMRISYSFFTGFKSKHGLSRIIKSKSEFVDLKIKEKTLDPKGRVRIEIVAILTVTDKTRINHLFTLYLDYSKEDDDWIITSIKTKHYVFKKSKKYRL
jgi:hypothetical protein